MVPTFLLVLLAAILVVYTLFPSVWLTIMARDDVYVKYRYMDVVGVASKNPFRESGPPVCMAKLIMMRHKIHQSNSRKRRAPPLPQSLSSSSPKPRVSPSPRLYPPSNFPPTPVPSVTPTSNTPSHKTFTLPIHNHHHQRAQAKRFTIQKTSPPRSSWMGVPTRFTRAFGKQHH
ncbi:hypothetical protein ONZ45_g499 [Pleurotus djamor]|nr:hypothetical protein ONZ45_g499 [Pleurotus djamor]